MNLFITSKSPAKSAKYLSQDRLRLNKQILECSQMLANAIINSFENFPKNMQTKKRKEFYLPKKVNGDFYKKTHVNHPVSKWVMQNERNYRWTYLFFYELCEIYKKLRGKNHGCASDENDDKFFYGVYFLPDAKKKTPFINCTPYKDLPVFKAYKKHLANKWK